MSQATTFQSPYPQGPHTGAGAQPPFPGAAPGAGSGLPPGGAPLQPWPPQPWPPERRGRTALVLTLAGAAVVLALVAATLVVVLGGRPDPAGSGGGGETDEVSVPPPVGDAQPGTEGQGGAESGEGTGPSGPLTDAPADPPADAPLMDPAAFLETLPEDFASCSAEAVVDSTGTLLTASCGAASSQPGPESASFFQYGSATDLTAVFRQDTAGVAALPAGRTCTTAQGYGRWADDQGSGEIACYLLDTGEAVLAWTDDEHLIEAFVLVAHGDQSDLAALYAWWRDNAFYRG